MFLFSFLLFLCRIPSIPNASSSVSLPYYSSQPIFYMISCSSVAPPSKLRWSRGGISFMHTSFVWQAAANPGTFIHLTLLKHSTWKTWRQNPFVMVSRGLCVRLLFSLNWGSREQKHLQVDFWFSPLISDLSLFQIWFWIVPGHERVVFQNRCVLSWKEQGDISSGRNLTLLLQTSFGFSILSLK